MLKENNICTNFLDSRFLVIGANGFIGSHLCTLMNKMGIKPFKLVRTTFSAFHDEGTSIEIDLTDRSLVIETITRLKPDYVVHLAGSKNRNIDTHSFRQLHDENLSISLNIIEASLAHPSLKKFIFLGSCDEYGVSQIPFNELQQENPTSPYGLSKLAITKFLSALKFSRHFPSIVLRPAVVYGPNQGDEMFLSGLIQSLLAGNEYQMTSGEQRRDFIYVDDVVEAILDSLFCPITSEGIAVNVGSGSSLSIANVAYQVAEMIHPDKCKLLKLGAVPYRCNEVMTYAVDIQRAKKLLCWQPSTSLEQGLLKTINHYKTKLDLPMEGL
jgi:nucleoside-diphosphate-sugar epimerase